MWESASEHFALWPGEGCRTIESADAGWRIFGIEIKPDTLAMRLTPPWVVHLPELAVAALAVLAVLGVLVRFRPRYFLLPTILIVLAFLVIAIDDASFLGGVRPFDGGDDGLFYGGYGRLILQKLLARDIWGALEGGEKVFYYGDLACGTSAPSSTSCSARAVSATYPPSSAAIRGLQNIPLFPARALVAHANFPFYRGAAGRAARHEFRATLEMGVARICRSRGLYSVHRRIGASMAGPGRRFIPAFIGALLLATGVFMKPIIAPAAAVLIGERLENYLLSL